MAILTQKRVEVYSETRMQQIRHYLKRAVAAGKPKVYSIIVDGLRVVEKSKDYDLFMDYKNFVGDATKEIEVYLYHGQTNFSDTYTFTMPEKKLTGELGFTEDEIEKRVNKRLIDIENETARTRVQVIEQELSEAKVYIKELETVVEQLSKQLQSKGLLQGILSGLFETGLDYVKKQPQILNGVPVIGETLQNLFAKPGEGVTQPHEASDRTNGVNGAGNIDGQFKMQTDEPEKE